MRLLALTRYSSLGPSSRIRFYQYIPYLTSCGVELQVAPLLDDDYVRSLYAGKRQSVSSVVMAYVSRIVRLANSRSFDLLWIEKELFPWLPAWAERLLAGLGIPYVVDYDDAVFHRYDLHANPFIRALLGKTLTESCAMPLRLWLEMITWLNAPAMPERAGLNTFPAWWILTDTQSERRQGNNFELAGSALRSLLLTWG